MLERGRVQASEVQRSILYCGPDQVIDTAESHLSQRGWIVHGVQRLDDIADELRKTRPVVGILVFDGLDLPRQQGRVLQAIAQSEGVRWLALVDKDSLANSTVRQLIGSAFYDYHTIPIDPERLLVMLGHAAGMAQISRDVLYTSGPAELNPRAEHMVGASECMQEVYQKIRKLAALDAPVLILGESGTGKEMAARAIHERSFRCDSAFVSINCIALPDELLRSELFGHEKGAFSGALSKKVGGLENADGGTLFLDEVHGLSLALQDELLQFLQDQTLRRLGSKEQRRVDVRILASCDTQLEAAVEAVTFRNDLFNRLNILNIHIPPLRERSGDVRLLAQYFFQRAADDRGQRIKGFTDDALMIMEEYSWPGNVRELINRVRRAMVVCDRILISPEDLGLERNSEPAEWITLSDARDQAEREAIKTALARNGGSITRAAEMLQISRVSLYRLMEKHGIVPPAQRER